MMNWRSLLFSMGVLAVATSAAWAQSNSALDRILATKTATFGDAAYLVMNASKKIPDGASQEAAVNAVKEQHWGIKTPQPQAPISLGTYSLLLMKAFDLRGGLMYSLFHSPRYAARELVYLGFVHGDGSPYRTISGIEMVDILRSVLNYKEGG